MNMQISIKQALRISEIEAVRQLLTDYGNSRDWDSALGDYDTELAKLPYRYAAPDGRLFLAFYDDQVAGCVAFQKLSEDICEMKRLYVDPDFRGKKVGSALIDAICKSATEAGYQFMRLDTFASFTAAIEAYKKVGFYEIPPYQKYGMEGILFFEKKLQ